MVLWQGEIVINRLNMPNGGRGVNAGYVKRYEFLTLQLNLGVFKVV